MSPQPASAPYTFVCSAEPSGSQTLPVTRDASPQPGGPAEWTAEGARLSSETGLYSMREPASAALSAEDVCLRDGFTPDSQAASSVEGERWREPMNVFRDDADWVLMELRYARGRWMTHRLVAALVQLRKLKSGVVVPLYTENARRACDRLLAEGLVQVCKVRLRNRQRCLWRAVRPAGDSERWIDSECDEDDVLLAEFVTPRLESDFKAQAIALKEARAQRQRERVDAARKHKEQLQHKYDRILATLRYVAAQTAGDRPQCPKCGADMKFRDGRYGPFWGCIEWPDCTGTCEFSGSLREYPGNRDESPEATE